jgi:hypothetical protein
MVQAVVVGTTVTSSSEWTSMTNFHDDGGRTVEEPSGAYVMVRGTGRPTTVGCRTGGPIRKALVGWVPGSQSKSWQITVDSGPFAAPCYLLADAGMLQPKPGSPS